MLDLLSDPAVWASFLTLTVLEIVLGVDNVIFISIVANRVIMAERRRARVIGLIGALVLRIVLLGGIAFIAQLEEPVLSVLGFDLSWRDMLMLAGGLFLLYKATTEIFAEVEGHHPETGGGDHPDHALEHRFFHRFHHHRCRHCRSGGGDGRRRGDLDPGDDRRR